ncbi:MAG: hypothetical protein IJU72_01160, partial [Bacteroidales bacterium]|nr:hypothetical protein [Bacteroidales bacterium]
GPLGLWASWPLGLLADLYNRYGSPRCIQIPHLQHEPFKARLRYRSLRGHPPHGVRAAPGVRDADVRGRSGVAVAVGHGLCQQGASEPQIPVRGGQCAAK